jgi:hypothetical protein
MSDELSAEPAGTIGSEGDSGMPPSDELPGPTFDLSIFVEPQGILCHFQCEGHSVEWTMPRTVVRRANKAMTIDHVFDLLGAGPLVGYFLREAVTNEPEFLMVPRAVNALTDRVTKALRQVQKDLRKAALAEGGTERSEESSVILPTDPASVVA